ncbi:MAG TPA: type II toxin-antitoxin system VapC family toxin [Lacunisphaera sp.]|nr:type II toxin-antitoxin system VapC family toxin [Lacunisphaera sp.]
MPANGDVLLDTTVVVAHLRGVTAVSQRLAETQTRYLPTVALGELHYGVHRSARPDENLRLLERWLRVAVLLSVTPATAGHYGRLKDQLARAGTPIPENDLWIAAVALEHGLPVATRDAHLARCRAWACSTGAEGKS